MTLRTHTGMTTEPDVDSDNESFDSMDVFTGTKKVPEPVRLDRLLEIQQPYNDNGRETFQAMVKLVQDTFDVPIALVSLVYEEIQWFKACVGLDVRETPRNTSFCAYTFEPLRPEVFCVPDATKDERFRENPLVTGAPHIRFYCGAPLITHDNVRLGALCMIDSKPRSITKQEMKVLINLAEVTVREIVKTEVGNRAWQSPPSGRPAPPCQLTPASGWRQGKIRQAWFERVTDQCVVVLNAGASPSTWTILWSNPNWNRNFKMESEDLWYFIEPVHGVAGNDVQRMVMRRLNEGESSVSFMVQTIGAGHEEAQKLFSCSVCVATKVPADTVNPVKVSEALMTDDVTPINVSSRRNLLMLIATPAHKKVTDSPERARLRAGLMRKQVSG
jgi:hypothetical protein